MPKNAIPCRDHTGQEFSSISEMSQAWGIPMSTVKNRLQRGWTLEQALTIPNRGTNKKVKHSKPLRDHEGTWFPCVREMCEKWGIPEKVYWSRKRVCKWPLNKILTTPVNDMPPNAARVKDHLGQEFPSISHMCRHWHVGLSTYRERRKRGWDLESALTEKQRMPGVPKTEACRDHLGNEYPSKAAMCKAWGKTRYCVQSRLDLGWDLKRALEEPFSVNARPCTDYKNRQFPTSKDMANFLGFPEYAFQSRKEPEKLIPGYAAKYWPGRQAGDIAIKSCLSFPWFRASVSGKPVIVHFESILDAWHASPDFQPLTTENRRLHVVKPVRFPWYLAELDGMAIMLDYWSLAKLNTETNFGLSKPDKK
ncbi:MAG: hypothetical protein NC311_14790 [Muribaculaceae bacterium]|nr:hypothetical protein [Muribaculaceae bacterium]